MAGGLIVADSSARLDALTSWHHDWKGLRVAVLGVGVTGFAAADTLTELGASVLVVASSIPDEQRPVLDVIGASVCEQHDLSTPPQALVDFDPELVIVSPGFAPQHPLVRWAGDAGITLWGDIELAWRLRDKVGEPADWILVTGTNGKTTTVQLTATMLVEGGLRAAPCGNIGIPVLDAIRDPQGFDVLVVELSSFQLHYLGDITPYSSVCLNIAEDHLDWHGSYDAYIAAKAKVYNGTRVACVYNRADPVTEDMVREADVTDGARAIGFGLGVPGPSDFGIVDGILCDRAFLDDRRSQALELTTVQDLAQHSLAAPHTVQNVLAAAALARSRGVSPEQVRDALRRFTVDHHRMEVVGEFSGITWVNDSKATNAHAANASLGAFDSIVWIVGGQLKGVSLDELISARASRVKAAVVIGVDRSEVTASFGRHAPDVPLYEVAGDHTDQVMPAVVAQAAILASDGDVVLLAPAAASMDQFVSYGDRGTRFAKAVQEFFGGEAGGRSAVSDPSGPVDH